MTNYRGQYRKEGVHGNPPFKSGDFSFLHERGIVNVGDSPALAEIVEAAAFAAGKNLVREASCVILPPDETKLDDVERWRVGVDFYGYECVKIDHGLEAFLLGVVGMYEGYTHPGDSPMGIDFLTQFATILRKVADEAEIAAAALRPKS